MPPSVDGKVNLTIADNEYDSDENPELLCYYCEAVLDFEFDYTCVVCGTLTCDNHNEVCQIDEEESIEGCDLVTCHVCAVEHMKSHRLDGVEVL